MKITTLAVIAAAFGFVGASNIASAQDAPAGARLSSAALEHAVAGGTYTQTKMQRRRMMRSKRMMNRRMTRRPAMGRPMMGGRGAGRGPMGGNPNNSGPSVSQQPSIK